MYICSLLKQSTVCAVSAWVVMCIFLVVNVRGTTTTRSHEQVIQQTYSMYPYPPGPDVDALEFQMLKQYEKELGMNLHPTLYLSPPSHLAQINHYLFQGKRDFCGTFRVLFAGGGTGHKTFLLASQLWDMKAARWEIVHVDLSKESIAIAQSRFEIIPELKDLIVSSVDQEGKAPFGRTDTHTGAQTKQGRIVFLHKSIFDLSSVEGLGLFDYIDTSGMFPTIEEQQEAAAVLSALLAPGGGMSFMMYGAIARYGINVLQSTIASLSGFESDAYQSREWFEQNIPLVRRLLADLPPTHPLRLDEWRFTQLMKYLSHDGRKAAGSADADAALVDTFLIQHEQTHTVDDIADLLASAGLAVVKDSFLPSIAYDPSSYLHDRLVLDKVLSVPWIRQASIAEKVSGNLFHHIFYATPVSRSPSSSSAGPSSKPHPEGVSASIAALQFLTDFESCDCSDPDPSSHEDAWPEGYEEEGNMYLIPFLFNGKSVAEELMQAGPVDASDMGKRRQPSRRSQQTTQEPLYEYVYRHHNKEYRFFFTSLEVQILSYIDGNTTIRESYIRFVKALKASLVVEQEEEEEEEERNDGTCTSEAGCQINKADTASPSSAGTASPFQEAVRVLEGCKWCLFTQSLRNVYITMTSLDRCYLSAVPIEPRSLKNINNFFDRQTGRGTDDCIYAYFTLQTCS